MRGRECQKRGWDEKKREPARSEEGRGRGRRYRGNVTAGGMPVKEVKECGVVR